MAKQNEGEKAPEKTTENVPAKVLTGTKAVIMNAKQKFVVANPKGLDFNTEANFAMQQLEANPTLMKCDPESVKNAFERVAMIGLSLNPALKLAYLIPRKNNSTGKINCVLDISYMGMIQALTDAGAVKNMDAGVIHENDTYDFNQGSNPFLKHRAALSDRGEMIVTGKHPIRN